MRITRISGQERRPDRVDVEVDGAFRCALALEVVEAARLRVGDEVDAQRLEELEARDVAWRARAAAYDLLAYRPRTRDELRRGILRKGFPDEVVGPCVAALAEAGLLDDAAFAASFVRERVRRRPRGVRRMVQELRARGVPRHTAQETVRDVMADQDLSELELAREAARAWVRRAGGAEPAGAPAAPDVARRRLYGYLSRRGFGGEVVRRVVAEFVSGP